MRPDKVSIGAGAGAGAGATPPCAAHSQYGDSCEGSDTGISAEIGRAVGRGRAFVTRTLAIVETITSHGSSLIVVRGGLGLIFRHFCVLCD